MSFSINPSHNFLVDTPIIVQEPASNTENNSTTAQSANNETKESNNGSNILSRGVPISGGLQVHQVAGALDDFY